MGECPDIMVKLEEAEAEAECTDIRYSSEDVLGAMRAEIVRVEENGKLERGLAQVRAGHGIVKSMDELTAMEEEENT